jgi:mannose-6-phosphate isomerase-like protein (cupin superfamily)
MYRTRYRDIPAYTTKDGAEIRELLHPAAHPIRNQSFAEARILPGRHTRLHRHRRSEELYHVTAGSGTMILGGQRFRIDVGDTVCIPPGTPHKVENGGTETLVILCGCAPSYSHADTELLEP